uniref:Uncharacterized protein n=1 Tax=Arundo donax TaxID=35708 RepID=A0A0A9HGW2_ARUDO
MAITCTNNRTHSLFEHAQGQRELAIAYSIILNNGTLPIGTRKI